ncbi:hypothetical protein DFJ58DRAFT_669460 [Suillus subalutaceus]|uniref:uncharacterized protein n=1 Tax=Suillus subalutaceus TaxID=48586 RepID=UPI001B86C90D|nr:uncharacterized protein DFJ58DRAFT_669460 [Suillus subalutaceus]KAG1836663.1 hypothetical protein DFJ58DRAFT_669460 [Suillus subalutaceus]
MLKKATTINGCVDYGIDHKLPSESHTTPPNQFQSLILLVEAKAADAAVPQLLAYLATIHHCWEVHGRTDTLVYGVASDGIHWKFVMITHSGLIKVSWEFSIADSTGTNLILECLALMLETAALMSLKTTPKKGEHTVEMG